MLRCGGPVAVKGPTARRDLMLYRTKGVPLTMPSTCADEPVALRSGRADGVDAMRDEPFSDANQRDAAPRTLPRMA